MQKKEVKAILFDLDGTLVDSFKVWFKVYNSALEKYGNKKLSIRAFKKRFGLNVEQDIKDYFHGATVKDIVDFYGAQFKLHIAGLNIFPQVRESLSYLKRKRVKMALVSNSSRPIILSILKHFKIKKYFSAIISLEAVKNRKPAPDMILKACKALNVGINEVILVGDTKNDMLAGKRAGCITVGYKIKGNYKISRLSNLIKLIQ